MSYARVKALVFVTLAAYGVVGLATAGTRHELYPTYSWALFSFVPNPGERITMTVSRAGGRTFDPPLQFSQTKFLFDELGQPPTQYTPYVLSLGHALRSRDLARVARERAVVERIFPPGAFRYSIVLALHDPVEAWKGAPAEVTEVLGTFEGTIMP